MARACSMRSRRSSVVIGFVFLAKRTAVVGRPFRVAVRRARAAADSASDIENGAHRNTGNPACPVTSCEDDRIVVKLPSIGNQDHAGQPIDDNQAERPEKLWLP